MGRGLGIHTRDFPPQIESFEELGLALRAGAEERGIVISFFERITHEVVVGFAIALAVQRPGTVILRRSSSVHRVVGSGLWG